MKDVGGPRVRQISPHPRYHPHRRNPVPYMAGGVAVVLVAFVVVLVVAIHPWSGGGTPSRTAAPTPTLPAPTPTPPPTDTPLATPTIAADSPTPNSGQTFAIYVIKRGDTVNSIAARFGITRAALLAANPRITNPNNIRVGMAIFIPWPGWVPPTPAAS